MGSSNIERSVKVEYTRSEPFDVKVGVHQGSILSSLLFALVMVEVTKDIREGIVKKMLYEDNIVLVGDNWKELSRISIHSMEESIKDKGIKISVNKKKGFLNTKKFCTNSNSKVFLLCMWQRSEKELCEVYKISTLGAQEVFRSSWKFYQGEGFYLQKMHPWCVISR